MIPHDRPHVMEGVVGILLTARRLLDAGECRYMGEHMLVVPTNWPPEGASRFGVAGESIIKNFLDICVVYLGVTVRVEIRGMEYFGLKRMSVQCVSLHRTRNVRKKERSKSKKSYVTGRLGDDLLGKVRHEEVIHIWVCQNDAFEV